MPYEKHAHPRYFRLISCYNQFSQSIRNYSIYWSYCKSILLRSCPCKRKDINQLMLNNAAANLHWKKAKTADIVFGISFAVNTVTSLVVYDQLLRDKTPAGGLYALAIGSGIIEIWSGLTSLSRQKKAILEYNSGFDKKEKVSLVPLGNQNGIGLALKF